MDSPHSPPWEESLDVDESDLPALVRPSPLLPCKRSRLSQTSSSFSLSFQPCSQKSRSSQFQPPKSSNPQFILSQSHQSEYLPDVYQHNDSPPAPSTSSRPLIPGPAGETQAGMHHKAKLDRREARGDLTTQEKKQMQEDLLVHVDEDFKRNPWLCAMNFFNHSVDSFFFTPLSTIKSCKATFARFPQVIGLVESCTPNGLGDLILTLKDPTGTVNASVHHKVLTESEFGMDISVGAVLILQQVVSFSPRREHYLNITTNNVLKVIRKDSGPPTQEQPTSSANCVDYREGECRATLAGMIDKAAFVRWGTAERIMNEAVRSHTQTVRSMNSDTAVGPVPYISNSKHQSDIMEVEPHISSEGDGKVSTMEICEEDGNEEQLEVNDNDLLSAAALPHNCRFSSSGDQHNASAAIKLADHHLDDPDEIGGTNGVGKPTQEAIPKTILPDWTDEQLDELFAEVF